MSILSTLQELGGCAGGKVVYYAAKYSAQIANITKQSNKLKADLGRVKRRGASVGTGKG